MKFKNLHRHKKKVEYLNKYPMNKDCLPFPQQRQNLG